MSNSFPITVTETVIGYEYREGENSLYTVRQTGTNPAGQPVPGFDQVIVKLIDHDDPDVPQEIKDLDTLVADYWATNIN